MLTDEQIAARIRSARALRGLSQDDLADLVAAEGLPWRLVGALERCEVTLRPAYRAVLADVLGMPAAWFTDPEAALWREGPSVEAIPEILDKLNTIIDHLEKS